MTDGITSPEEFFGFQMGSEGHIAHWDRVVEYFRLLQEESEEIRVIEMGPTTEGRPFLLVVISASENLEKLEQIRRENLRLSDPRGLTEEEVGDLIANGRAVVCQSMSLHATEIGGTQMAPELAHELLSRGDEDARRILENVVFLMVPCFNPDGQVMVVDWYNRWKGTEYEGVNLPWLYHKYAGHDNNRDAFQVNLVESGYVASILFRDWIPQAYVDHHHMGSYGARFYIPPYCEPFRGHADPIVYREHYWYGSHMAYMLEEAGKTGVIGGASTFPAWGHFGWHRITNHHNVCGMLTESANAKLATPLYIHPGQLRGNHFTFPEYEAQNNFPNPWPGGLWTLREIVEQQKISAWATLDIAARNREMVLRNAYLKAKRQTERGAAGSPSAFVVPACQHDPLTAAKLVEKLLVQGIEVHLTREGFAAGGVEYPAGSYVVSMAQPKSGVVRWLLGRTFYPDNPWTREADGTPRRPKDKSTDTMSEFMGVRVDPVDCAIEADLEKVTEPALPEGGIVAPSEGLYAMDCRLNDSFTVVNRLMASGFKVRRSKYPVECGSVRLPSGAFIVEGSDPEALDRIAAEAHIDLHPVKGGMEDTSRVRKPRIGLYERYWGGNADEGWTRLVLEQFEFPHEILRDDDIRRGKLIERLDVLILPSDSEEFMTGEGLEERARRAGRELPNFPSEYRSGIGEEGVEALKDFVEEGGTLICLNESCELGIKALKLKVRNALEGLHPKQFFCPGSTLRVRVDADSPWGYGMPYDGLLFHWDSPAFEVLPSGDNERYDIVASYGERDILQSGWLIGEGSLKRKAAMVVAHKCKGRVALMGFRPQHRAQTHGTYKLLFNCLLG
jgi:hypothetical protein